MKKKTENLSIELIKYLIEIDRQYVQGKRKKKTNKKK